MPGVRPALQVRTRERLRSLVPVLLSAEVRYAKAVKCMVSAGRTRYAQSRMSVEDVPYLARDAEPRRAGVYWVIMEMLSWNYFRARQ